MKKQPDAIALIEVAAKEPSLDELAARARQVLALKEPTPADMADLTRYWRAQRASWGVKKEAEDADTE